jgi:hypothetical protein
VEKDKYFFSDHSRREFLGAVPLLCGGLAMLNVSGHTDAKEVKAGVPRVKIPERSIFMRLPESALYGITVDEKIEITLNDVIKVHGYCVGGGTFSFRAAEEAFKLMYGNELPVRHKVKVQTSHHCCQAAALGYITGARRDYGAYHSQGNLILLPVEDKKIVFTDIPGGKSVTLRPLFNPHDTFEPLFKRAKKEPGFAPEVSKVMNEKIDEYLNAPVEKIFIVES